MKKIELTIDDETLPAVLGALSSLKGIEGLVVQTLPPKRVRVRKSATPLLERQN